VLAEVVIDCSHLCSSSRSPVFRSRSRSPRDVKRHASDRSDRGRDQKIRLFVSNIPYDMRWQDLKDLFREKGASDSFFQFDLLYIDSL